MNVQRLNDSFRRTMGAAVRGRFYLSAGVAAKSDVDRFEIIQLVRQFEDFDKENDPYSEHDFGSFDFRGEKIMFKIDYFADSTLEWGAEDKEDCFRVLTILLLTEY